MKFELVLVIACLLFTACGDKVTPTEQAKTFEADLSEVVDAELVEKRCAPVKSEFRSSVSEVATLGQKYPAFMVQGNVTDTSEGALQIFGRAFVNPSKGLSHWASSGNERNVIVIHPKNSIHNPSYYVGEHYFIKKDSGKNGFGADVPVWVFGDPPEELALAIQNRIVQERKLGMCNARLKELATLSNRDISSPTPVSSAPEVVTPPTAATPPSFDCAKASLYVEREVCSSQLLRQLDAALSANFKHMLASDIGNGARSDLQKQQRSWLETRNMCTSSECIMSAYRARMDAVCDVPVLSGVHPQCITSGEIK